VFALSSFKEEQMKIKLLVPICGPEGSFKVGDIAELTETLAKALIKDRHAESFEVKKSAEENLRKIFSENPDIKQAFKDTLDKMSKPENIEKMSKEIHGVIKKVDEDKKTVNKKQKF
jgi:hypothetical protein